MSSENNIRVYVRLPATKKQKPRLEKVGEFPDLDTAREVIHVAKSEGFTALAVITNPLYKLNEVLGKLKGKKR